MLASPLARRFLALADRALPRAFGRAAAPGREALERHWRLAAREVAARLALALARERLLAAELAGDALILRGPVRVALPLRARRPLELHAPDLDADRHPLLEDPALLLAHQRPDLLPIALARLCAELSDSAFNLALARVAAEMRDRTCANGQTWPAPLDPESLVVEGHPWHPMCKTRLGLRAWENLRHGPDLLAQAPVHAVDLAAEVAVRAGEWDAIAGELFPPAPAGWRRLPVHALQLRRLPRLLGELWGRAVRPAPVPPRPARALLSLRSVALAGAPLHLKLSADVHTTSARRQVSPMSARNGPTVTALLARIQARDPHARRGLRIQPELAAAGLDPARGPGGQLGVIVRPDPVPLARELVAEDLSSRPDPEVIVCAALGARRPAGDLLLRECSAAYPGDPAARLGAFFDDYLARLVPPALRLWVAHGVALEAHLQNTLLVQQGGRPRGFIVRDLGGIRLHHGRLATAGHPIALAPGSFTATGDLAEAQIKLLHTLVHAHLGTLIGWIDDAGGPPPDRLWPRVRAAIEGRLRAWAEEDRLAAACAEDRAALLADVCAAKALFTMRIDERTSEYAYTRVANPLGAGYPPRSDA